MRNFLKLSFAVVFLLGSIVHTSHGKSHREEKKDKIGAASSRSSKGHPPRGPFKSRGKGLQKWLDRQSKEWNVEINPDTGTPHRISGQSIRIVAPIREENIEEVSRSVILTFKDILQVDPDALELSKADFQSSDNKRGTWYVYFRQNYQGFPVIGGSVRLVFRGQHLTMMGSDYYPEIDISVEPEITEEKAVEIANQVLAENETLQPESISLAVLPQTSSEGVHYHLVWDTTMPEVRALRLSTQDNPVVTDPDTQQEEEIVPVRWRYLIDANTGAVLDRINLLLGDDLNGTVTGMIYPFSPLDAQIQEPIEGIEIDVTQDMINYTSVTGAGGQYSLPGLSSNPLDLQAHLKGPRVQVHNNETPDPDATHWAPGILPGLHGWDWSLDDPSPNQVETNAFYHLNLIRNWFLRGGPFNILPARPSDATSDYVRAFVRDGEYCNAYAAVGAGILFFGSGYSTGGCEDLALCADIIYHEYGHLIIQQIYDDANVNIFSLDHGGAMHEGFADYFGATITNNPALSEGCFSGRNFDTPDRRYPDDFNLPNPHSSGMIISGAVWDTKAILGADQTDSLAIRALKQVPLSFQEFLGAFLEEDDDPNFFSPSLANNDLSDGTPNIDTICQTFYDGHGIYHSYCAGHTNSPVAIITFPSPLNRSTNTEDGSNPTITILGTAEGSLNGTLQSYSLDFAHEEDLDTWRTDGMTLTNGGGASVDDDVLGQWDISGVADGFYLIRLTVTNTAAETAVAYTELTIDRGLMTNWPQRTDRYFISTPAAVDLDPDYPGLEIVVRNRDGTIYAWHADGTLVSGWPQYRASWPPTPPAIADLDGDGTLEVVVAEQSGTVLVFNHDGTRRSGWPMRCSSDSSIGRDMLPSVGDLDGDGQGEIVVATVDGSVCAWHEDGSIMSGWPVALDGSVRYPLAVGDVDNNGKDDVIVVTRSDSTYVLKDDGSTLGGWPQSVTAPSSSVLADFDDDGDLEIVTPSPSRVYMWEHDGSSVPGWPKEIGKSLNNPLRLSVADVDQDGALDVLLYHLQAFYGWASDGTVLPGFPMAFCDSPWCPSNNHPSVVGDIDGNGDRELVALREFVQVGRTQEEFLQFGERFTHKLIGINEDGTSVTGMPKYIPSKWGPSTPVIADVDQDGDVELVIGAFGVFIWDLPGAYSASTMDWPEFRHDARRSGSQAPPLLLSPVIGGIAFASNRDGDFEIYKMNADGSGVPTRLTNNGANDEEPSWSPDGTEIAFASDRDGNFEIYKMNADGSGQTRLTNSLATDSDPSWSPDGTQIVFESHRDGNLEIYKMNADGSGQTRLTNSLATDADPSWSPDGTQIVFSSFRDGYSQIYVMNADGSGQTNLSNLFNSFDVNPSWSPAGTEIVFQSQREGNAEIFKMNADGSGQTNLSNFPGANDLAPEWSPDGTQIVFERLSLSDFNFEIYKMNADGSGQTNLSNNAAIDKNPSWD